MFYDPAVAGFFPACPFHSLTGLQCPGCGSQRAIHHLLNFDVVTAFQHNGLLVVSIPYILLGLTFDRFTQPSERLLRWRKFLFGRIAIFLILTLIILFWIFRNF